MKPFDLEAAKRGEPIITRDGREVKFIAHVPEASLIQRVVALVNDNLVIYHENGRFSVPDCCEHRVDLFMAPIKRVVYVNLYLTQNAIWYQTEEAANLNALHGRLGNKAHMVEIEE